jgi:hypothetical protein
MCVDKSDQSGGFARGSRSAFWNIHTPSFHVTKDKAIWSSSEAQNLVGPSRLELPVSLFILGP